MPHDSDHYESYYADKLWRLLPEVYRADDALTDREEPGPLRELVDRIGVQAAIIRRSLDRLWDDQSIETCDDWLIPYIGDLLATNLVASVDTRGQRLDVARTIYYRRRKGTPALLEELAADITGWNAHLVELFRRLSRTRHGLDPEIGLPSATDDPDANRALQQAEALVGTFTGTPMGGLADLRNAYGASLADTSCDEFFHTADVRRGRGALGWYGIPKLGVFLWRLQSFAVDGGDPVPCPTAGVYTFDPTGRLAPLFMPASRRRSSYGDAWISPKEWQLPGPLSSQLLNELLALPNGPATTIVDVSPGGLAGATVHPELGTFRLKAAAAVPLSVFYHYGFPSAIGAGTYDRRLLDPLVPTPAPVRPDVTGGRLALQAELGALAGDGTVTIGDNRTYTAVADVGLGAPVHRVTVRARNRMRPVIRLGGATEWAFVGDSATGDDQELVLDGLFLSGVDIVLRGKFRQVRLKCCTLDPGTAGTGTHAPLASSVDDVALGPSRLFVEAEVERLDVDRCILGGIRSRGAGKIETLTVRDSIVQAIRTTEADPADLALALGDGTVDLERCTLLGPAHVHRLSASECILDDTVVVEDVQHGCIRFTAYASDSVLPRKYESVTVAPAAPLFETRDFGQPHYAQLLSTADNAIRSGTNTISAGGPAGSELGAYAGELVPIKERSLLIKYDEYMPIGLSPVVVDVT